MNLIIRKIFYSLNSYVFGFQVGHVAYHNFNGILVDSAERESIIHDLGQTSKVRKAICFH